MQMKAQMPLKAPLDQAGAVLPLAAVCVFAIVSLMGFSFYLLSYGAQIELSKGSTRLIALAAVEGYMAHTCAGDSENSVANCHAGKAAQAIARAEKIVGLNPSSGFLQVVQLDAGTPWPTSETSTPGDVYVKPGRWITTTAETDLHCDQDSLDSNGFSKIPCFASELGGKYANAYKVRGFSASKGASRHSLGFVSTQISTSSLSESVAVANPEQMVIVADLSTSSSDMTHLSPRTQAAGDFTCSEQPAGSTARPTYFAYPFKFVNSDGMARGGVGEAGGTRNAPNTETAEVINADGSVGPNGDDTCTACIWSAIPRVPGSRPADARFHYKDDFYAISSYGASAESNELYRDQAAQDLAQLVDGSGTNATLHLFPEPGDGSGVTWQDPGNFPEDDSNLENYFIDAYRDGVYNGPEPYMSIMEGVQRVAYLLKERQVEGDLVGLVTYGSNLRWSGVINLTQPQYVLNALDMLPPLGTTDPVPSLVEQLTDNGVSQAIEAHPAHPDVTALPNFIKLGLFPKLDYTNSLVALTEANHQLVTRGGVVSESDAAAPSIKTVIHLSDGLVNCKDDGTCNSSDVTVYDSAMSGINTFANQHLFKKGIIFSMIQFGGKTGGQHRLALSDGAGGCLTEEAARAAKIPTVRGDSYTGTANEQANARAQNYLAAINDPTGSIPIYDVARNWYDIVRMTGGIYEPILPPSSARHPACSSTDPATASRLLYNYDNKSESDQIKDALEAAYKRGHAYTVVYSK